jgi:hypothetical protein
MRRLPVESLGPGATSPVQRHRRRGQVVRQRTANPLSPVRIRAAPLRCPFCVLGPSDPPAHPLRSPARMRTAGSSRGDRFRYRASARSVPRAPTRPRIALTGRPEAHPGGASSLPFLRTRAIGSSGPSPAQPRPDENRRFEPRRPIPVSRVSALRAAGADAAEDRPYWATGGPSGRRLYPDSPKHNKSSGRPESAATPLSHGWSDSCTRCTW